jgi:hypothetical protein
MSNVTPSTANQPLDHPTQQESNQVKGNGQAQMRGHEFSINPPLTEASKKTNDIFKDFKKQPVENPEDFEFNIILKENFLHVSYSEQENSNGLPDDVYSDFISRDERNNAFNGLNEEGQALQEGETEIVFQAKEIEKRAEEIEKRAEVILKQQEIAAQALEEVKTVINNREFDFANQASEKEFDESFTQKVITNLEQSSSTDLPEALADLMAKSVEKAVEEGKIGKRLPDGSFAPLTRDEIKQLIGEIKIVLTAYFRSQLPMLIELKKKQELEKDHKTQTQGEDKKKIHVAVVIRNDQREPTHADERSIKVALEVAVLIQLIIMAAINEKKQQERAEEKQEQKLLDLIDRIKRDIIKKEILNQDILKTEIKSKELKNLVNKYINLPLEELVKIGQVYSKSNGQVSSNRKIRVRLSGLHKMKPISAPAA